MAGADAEIRELGESILSRMATIERGSRRGDLLFGKMMAYSMARPRFKARMFRLVDVLPALNHPAETAAHVRQYLRSASPDAPVLRRLGIAMSFAPALAAPVVRHTVSRIARQFILSEDPASLPDLLRQRRRLGLTGTVDLLGEAVVSETEVERYSARVTSVLETLSESFTGSHPPSWKPNPRFPEINLSLKISALDARILPPDPDGAIQRLKQRLRPIVRHARDLGAFINLDMEDHQLKELTLLLFRSFFEDSEFRNHPHCGIAIQAYLRESEGDLRELIEWTRARPAPITVRLVKGAYWDHETILARQKNWPVPVFEQKAATDHNFERLTLLLLENAQHTIPAIATHNVRSIAHAIVHAARLGLSPEHFEFQLLYGMADSLKQTLVERGYRVREYCPVGELIPGMAYLVRRLLENSSNEGFLATRSARRPPPETLLVNPQTLLQKEASAPNPAQSTPSTRPNPPAFQNFPPTDFTMKNNRESMQRALASVRKSLGNTFPLIIAGKETATTSTLPSLNPAHPETVVGIIARAGQSEANRAVAAANDAFSDWANTSPDTRAQLLDTTAGLLEKRRMELAALEIIESGKPWAEADADVCEAIDFCRFYAATLRELAIPKITQPLPGEENLQVWRPRGVAAIIAPWNFPLAILCGMTTAALVTGNTVVMKPAEQSSVIAARFMEVLIEAGFPPGAVNLLTGLGEEAGAPLVEHPDVAVIAFTGSRDVGLRIWESAGKTRPAQRHLKKVICEMGGKNALIVDSDADLDEALEGALYSAFGYQGQKCSALSRLIVLKEVYDRFLERFVEAAPSLTVGDPAEPGTFIGPLIDEAARTKVTRSIEVGKRETRLVFEGKVPRETSGYFVPPVIFADVPRHTHIFREEIFGPVVGVTKAGSFDEAIDLANDSAYGLTAGLYSRSPAHIERAKRELEAGNIYINRHITGSIVGRQPFGGFKLSGNGTKAGGREYLLQFMVPQVLTENTVRHGFAPETA